MQDRFKFRAYNFLSKKYTYFDEPEVQFAERNSVYLCGLIMPLLDEKQSLYFGKYELQQCTGLKDKHGKLIYESDLLRYPPKDKDEEINYVICEVFFHNNDCCDTHIGFQMNRFHFKGNLCGIINYARKYNFIPENTEKMEIIGNIYENPELIGGAE